MGASVLFKHVIDDSNTGLVALKEWLGRSTHHLEEAICEAKDFEARISIIERFLFQQLATAVVPHRYESIQGFVSNVSNPYRKSDYTCCIGQRQFQRHFSRMMGFTKKRFERILRFQKALFIKQYKPQTDMLSLVYQCGYFDQAHMIHDFKELSGYTPSDYFKVC